RLRPDHAFDRPQPRICAAAGPRWTLCGSGAAADARRYRPDRGRDFRNADWKRRQLSGPAGLTPYELEFRQADFVLAVDENSEFSGGEIAAGLAETVERDPFAAA